jgi:SpoVK/Ycf46/Vps4 family AAA+-type ATPase
MDHSSQAARQNEQGVEANVATSPGRRGFGDPNEGRRTAKTARHQRSGANWSVEAEGILDSRCLPDDGFEAQWESIIVDPLLKEELLAQGVLNYTLRAKVDRALVPLHGIILLVGPPGTGKTSLARGLASRIAEAVHGAGRFRYMEVEPHALAGAALGRSQKAVTQLFAQTIAEQADEPLIVLLDEVETLAADRSKMSLEANPIDVHRATDAVLAQLDHLAGTHPNLLILATSNFADAIDGAFLSRADLVRTVGLPTPDACKAILLSTLDGLATAYPAIGALRDDRDVALAASACVGQDGRQIRKLVVAACARRKEVAINPALLRGADILAAARAARAELRKVEEP